MILKRITTDKQISDRIKVFQAHIIKQMSDKLIMVGTDFVKNAREKASESERAAVKDANIAARLMGGTISLVGSGSFKDWTGNLRSSIGFVVSNNGKILHKDFEPSAKGTDKKTGMQHGLSFAKSLVPAKGISLIVVAGEDYASYVESKGYDVITGSSIAAEHSLRQIMKAISK